MSFSDMVLVAYTAFFVFCLWRIAVYLIRFNRERLDLLDVLGKRPVIIERTTNGDQWTERVLQDSSPSDKGRVDHVADRGTLLGGAIRLRYADRRVL